MAMKIEKEKYCSVDENTIPYKGMKSKQYNPKQLKKCGYYKLYMICTGKFGTNVGTSLNTGKQTVPGDSRDNDLPQFSALVKGLRKMFPNASNFKLVFGNWVCFPLQLNKLFRCGIQSVATF